MSTIKELHDLWIPPQEHRTLFSDGWRSMAHFTLGYTATNRPEVLTWFAIYEVLPIHTDPLYAIFEFGLGYAFGSLNKQVY
jgi:hypothetical protein